MMVDFFLFFFSFWKRRRKQNAMRCHRPCRFILYFCPLASSFSFLTSSLSYLHNPWGLMSVWCLEISNSPTYLYLFIIYYTRSQNTHFSPDLSKKNTLVIFMSYKTSHRGVSGPGTFCHVCTTSRRNEHCINHWYLLDLQLVSQAAREVKDCVFVGLIGRVMVYIAVSRFRR